MKKLILIIAVGFLQACTTQMYVAQTTFIDNDEECTAQGYWYKTDYIFGVKADRVLSIASGGGRKSVEFKESDGRMVFQGDAARDVKVIGEKPAGQKFVCGWVEDLAELVQFEGDKLVLNMHCKAKTDSLSKAKGYIPASEAPYSFTVSKEELMSLFGDLPEPPRPPECVKRPG